MIDPDSGTTSRRHFLEKIFAATVVAVAAPTLALGRIIPTLGPSNGALTGRYRIDLGDPDFAMLGEVGGSVRLDSIAGITFSVIVTRISAAEFAAVNATCTHEGCTVDEVLPDSGGLLVCPCHGSRFTPTGTVVRGPAPRALKRYETFFDGGTSLEIEIAGIASSPGEAAIGVFVGTPWIDRDRGRVRLDLVLESATELRAAIHSIDGALVAEVFNGRLDAGEHELGASLARIASGAYLFRVETSGSHVTSRRFVVSR